MTYEGRNEWFAGGWTGNYFRETAGTAVRGDGPGWVAVTGNETVGVGTYRGAPVEAGAAPVPVPGPATGAVRAPAAVPAG